MSTVQIAKWVMKLNQTTPTFDKNGGGLREAFTHPAFLQGSSAERHAIMLKSSETRYIDEIDYPIDEYFGFALGTHLENKSVLDLGCGTGGRAVAWFERYRLKDISGLEIDEVYTDAARRFAERKGVAADFKVGFGENIPFADNSFDAVLTFDVLEHVADVEKVLEECWRVLKPSGKLFLVFPTYYQPVEHHLGMVSKVPGLQFFFSGKTLVRAYYEIIEERGADSRWYKRKSPELAAHEAGHTINGTSFRKFRQLVRKRNWRTVFVSRKPIGSVGRSVRHSMVAKGISSLFAPLTYIPYVQEVFLHRVTMVLQKNESG